MARSNAVNVCRTRRWGSPAFINSDLHRMHFDKHTLEMKTPLRIAILECDTPLPNVVERFGRYDRIFSTLLETAAEGLGLSPKNDLQMRGYDVVDKQEYPNLDDIDAILISGSSA